MEGSGGRVTLGRVGRDEGKLGSGGSAPGLGSEGRGRDGWLVGNVGMVGCGRDGWFVGMVGIVGCCGRVGVDGNGGSPVGRVGNGGICGCGNCCRR
ncbi:hypothetical protein SLE2022_154810 [Rubroshorea leprosula]